MCVRGCQNKGGALKCIWYYLVELNKYLQMNRSLLVLIGLSLCFLSHAQDDETMSWKGYKKKAEDLIELRQYAKAAAAYEQAFALKPQRGDFMVDAAENYALERDFANAARAYSKIIENSKYKNSKLDYAYALKQSNQYVEAMVEFTSYLGFIDEKDSEREQIINKEVAGCQFALEQIEGFVVKPYGIDIKPISEEINSPESDFAPFHVSDTKFYYSTLEDGNATIKSSSWMEGMWSEGKTIKGFNGLKSKHVCNAVVNPDETEMFFTICDDKQVWGGLSSRCDIYVSTFKGKAWGQPKKLNDNVNNDGSTNTQPYVLVKDGEQQIYFASNRPNGQGGMDLWFASRPLEEKEFGEAVNLGPNVNTKGNEITPFISEKENTLYFSSDGHITMGGFDIMKAIGSEFKWSQAENLGRPINSGADEKYYTIASNSTEGYFATNRTSTGETNSNEDIFMFNILPPHFFVEGMISDEKELTPIDQAEVFLYELKAKTQDRRLLSVQDAAGGRYNYRLLPNRNYQLVVEADGYGTNTSYVNTNDEKLYVQEINILLNDADLQIPVVSINNVLPEDKIVTAPKTSIPETTIIADTPVQEKSTETVMESIVEEITASQALVVETPKEEITFTETVDAVTENIKNQEYVKPTAPETTETYIESKIISENSTMTDTYTAVDNNFVNKGDAKVPTGTGIYNYDNSNYIYKKEGTLLTEEPVTFAENSDNTITFSEPTYGNTVAAIEVPLDKYAEKKSSTSVRNNTSKTSVSKASQGITYQVQLIAVEYHNPANRRYDGIRNLGMSMHTEYIEGKGWTRVLLGAFKSEKEARSVLENARSSGFKRAFVVEYKDGQRKRRIK